MKYAIVKVFNGNYAIHAETTNLKQAKVNFHGVCQTLWNADDVNSACIAIVDENLNIVDGYKEYISKAITEE